MEERDFYLELNVVRQTDKSFPYQLNIIRIGPVTGEFVKCLLINVLIRKPSRAGICHSLC